LPKVLQALQNIHDGDGSVEELQRQVARVLRNADLLPRVVGQAPPEPEEMVVPEPNELHLQQLQEMGFSAAAARRALLLHRDSVAPAVSYLLSHSDGPLEAEPTAEELRCALGRC
jgi:uncharacterized UBP type Zn finger protein